MKRSKLRDGTSIFCLLPTEAIVLDHHVEGYLRHGITLDQGSVIFDVGANIGVFGLRMMQQFSDSRVYAFEPVPAIYECLKANADFVQHDRFHTFLAGISDQKGELTFTYYPNSPALSTAKPEQWDEVELREAVDGSIAHPPPHMWYTGLIPKWLRSLIAKWFARRMRSNPIEVTSPLLTVSEVIDGHSIECIDLLKIDCEGAELECLMGIRTEHWPVIQQVVVEVHDQNGLLSAVQERLFEMGLNQQVVEQEDALQGTRLHNIFAWRSHGHE